MPRHILIGVGVAAFAVTLVARQNRPAQQPTFRAGVDFIQLDVVVLYKDRRPVTGLTAADFTILEAGTTVPIETFKAVQLPAPVPPPVAWMRDVPRDVTTNAETSGRAVVVVMESPTSAGKRDPTVGRRPLGGPSDQWADKKMRAAAASIIKNLTPEDLAAVVYTWGGLTSSQGFTTDHGRLLKALDDHPPMTPVVCAVCTDGACCNLDTLTSVIAALGTLEQQPKTVFFINSGFGITPTVNTDLTTTLLQIAQRAHVTIQTVDPQGLTTTTGINAQTEGLRVLAENTGGRAVVNHNEPETVMPEVMSETRTYYLLGFQAAPAVPGGFHAVRVVVNRPDVEVRTRSGYYDPATSNAKIVRTVPAGTTIAAIEGLLAKGDVPLFASVAPFADAKRKPVLAINLGVGGSQEGPTAFSLVGGRSEAAEVLAELFDSNGRRFGSTTLSLNVPVGSRDGEIRYELLPRLAAPSRRFEARLGLKLADGRTASVFTWVDVPDFARERLSMSGLVLNALPAPPAEPRTGFADLMPVVPTARRDFGARDFVTAAARIYQGGSRTLVPVTITTRVVNGRDEEVASDSTQLDALAFGSARSADYKFTLPIAKLPGGEYLLRVTAAAGSDSSERALRFTVR